MRITNIVAVANQRFHDALDEIEVEIVRPHSSLCPPSRLSDPVSELAIDRKADMINL